MDANCLQNTGWLACQSTFNDICDCLYLCNARRRHEMQAAAHHISSSSTIHITNFDKCWWLRRIPVHAVTTADCHKRRAGGRTGRYGWDWRWRHRYWWYWYDSRRHGTDIHRRHRCQVVSQERVNVVGRGKTLEEWDEVKKSAIRHVVKPGHHRDLHRDRTTD